MFKNVYHIDKIYLECENLTIKLYYRRYDMHQER